MNKIRFLLFFIVLNIGSLKAQISEVECTVYRRAAAYITLTPALYNQESLPPVGSKIMLSIYVKDNLPINKEEGFYELFLVEIIKLIPETKSITCKATGDFESRKNDLGLPDLKLNTESKVKISWSN